MYKILKIQVNIQHDRGALNVLTTFNTQIASIQSTPLQTYQLSSSSVGLLSRRTVTNRHCVARAALMVVYFWKNLRQIKANLVGAIVQL